MSRALPYPPRIPLAQTPTPLEPLARTGQRLGVELFVKRDDLTGVELSGNKVRKLEFLLAEAKARSADVVITCGGAQSNHCRATAAACAKLGLGSRLLLRTPDPQRPPVIGGNILLDRMVGADIVWITPEEYRHRGELMAAEARKLTAAGRRPYVIPEGGSNALGSWGYVRAVEELSRQLPELPSPDTPLTLVYAAGSGGTGAGLVLGVKLLGLNARVVGVNVCDDRPTFVACIGDIVAAAIREYGLDLSFERAREVEIVDGYVGRGYALSRPEELQLLCEVARTEGLILDPVYTGKTFYGLVQELKRDPQIFGPRIVFFHTGGIFGLFPLAAELGAEAGPGS